MAQAMTSALGSFNPFSAKEDAEEQGETIQPDSIGGGGHAGRKSQTGKDQLRVSRAIKEFLANQNVLPKEDVDHGTSPALAELLNKPHLRVPRELTDRSWPISEYFISSSHNTYLVSQQLYGNSDAVAYSTALNTGARCVEIDAWDNEADPQEPKVTHGYTLVSHTPFRKVCETMRDVIDAEAKEPVRSTGYRAGPIFLSLENHTSAQGQKRLVEIMKEVWGHRLISKRVQEQEQHAQADGTGDHVKLEQLQSNIAVIVEYHFGEENEEEEDVYDGTEDQIDKQAEQGHAEYQEQKKKAPKASIIPELAELGVYAQSVKPRDQSWLEGKLKDGPHDHLINVSESGLGGLMPHSNPHIGTHNSQHLMRVFPKGTRISSHNLQPVPFWGVGAQICALNWQTFDASLQLNEALFANSDGYILKPAALRTGGSGHLGESKKRRLRLHVAGVTDVPVAAERKADDVRPYVTCTLVHPSDHKNQPPKRKTKPYKPHKIGLLHKGENPPPTDPIFDEVLEWDFEDNELTFLRILIKSDDTMARNPVLAVAAIRLLYVTEDWSFIRMLNLKGGETTCTLLAKFELSDA